MSGITVINLSNAVISGIFSGYPIQLTNVSGDGGTTNSDTDSLGLRLYNSGNGNDHAVSDSNLLNIGDIPNTFVTYMDSQINDNTTGSEILHNDTKYYFVASLNTNRKTYAIVRYYTSIDVTVSDINLNNSSTGDFQIKWVSDDYSTSSSASQLSNDVGPKICLNNSGGVIDVGRIKYGSYFAASNDQTKLIPTGTYIITVEFDFSSVSFNSSNTVYFKNGSGTPTNFTNNPLKVNSFTTSSFSYITKYIKSVSISSTNILLGVSYNLTIDVGNGYTGYKYTIAITHDSSVIETINDFIFGTYSLSIDSKYTLDFTYTITVTNQQQSCTPRTTTFTVNGSQLVSVDITNKIIESNNSAITWVGGSTQEKIIWTDANAEEDGTGFFRRSSDNNSILNQSDLIKLDALEGYKPNVKYTLTSFNSDENVNNLFVYFDSIASGQSLNPIFLNSASILIWNATFTEANPVPEGETNPRIYTVNITPSESGGTIIYSGGTGQSNYNTLTLGNLSTSLTANVPYDISIAGITIATGYEFQTSPSAVTISPNYFNYTNTISWTGNTGSLFYVTINENTESGISTVDFDLTEGIYPLNVYNILFSLVNVVTGVSLKETDLTANTFSSTAVSPAISNSFWKGGPISIFDTYTFTSANFSGNYLYYYDDGKGNIPATPDTYYLSVHRSGTDIPFETGDGISFTGDNYTWSPSSYTPGTFKENDQIKLKSKTYVNYGYSGTIGKITNPVATAESDDGTTGYINYKSSISWSPNATTLLYVTINGNEQATAQQSPVEIDFYQDKYPITPLDGVTGNSYVIYLSSDTVSDNKVPSGTIEFTDNTFTTPYSFWSGGDISILQPVTFESTYFKTAYLYYGTETYNLSISDGTLLQQGISFDSSGNYVWYPYAYPFETYKTDDKIKLKSSTKLNYGYSGTFNVKSGADTIFITGLTGPHNFISKITATIDLNDVAFSGTFTVHLCKSETLSIPLDSITFTSEASKDFSFYPYNTSDITGITGITGATGTNYLYLDTLVYLKVSLYSDTTLIISANSDNFTIASQYFNVTTDYNTYTSISDITTYTTFDPITTTTYYDEETPDTFTLSLDIGTHPSNIVSNLPVTDTSSSNILSHLWSPYEFRNNIDGYLVGSFSMKATSNTYGISNNIPFEITKNYVTSTTIYADIYLTIAPITTNFQYHVTGTNESGTFTTTTHFKDTLTITSGSNKIGTPEVDVANYLKNDYIFTFYPYPYFLSDYDLEITHSVTFTPVFSDPITIGSFNLNPNSIESPTTGNFSVLAPIEITWYRVIDNTSYTVGIDDFNLKENDITITSSTNTPYPWDVYTTSYFGPVLITIRSNKFLILTTFTINIVNASAADYGLLQNRKLGVAPCSSISLTPALSRATTNTICVPTKKNNVPTTTIKLGDRTFRVPCGVVQYLPELKFLITKMSLRDALLFLIKKYDIPVPTKPVQNVKRYQYPTSDATIKYPIIQFNTSFRLGDAILGSRLLKNPLFVEKRDDARILEVCNDDTKTFSFLYTDMLQNCTYWLSTLPSFKEASFTYCIIRPTNASLKKVITGSISLRGNVLVFTPIILKPLLFFYQPYAPNTDITIIYSNPDVSAILTYIQEKYFQETVVINSACL